MVLPQSTGSVDGLSVYSELQSANPVGCIRWIDGRLQVQVHDEGHRPRILDFLSIAAKGNDFLIRREPSDSNRVLLQAEKLPIGSPAFLTRQALSLTFHPLNQYRYIFKPASLAEPKGREVADGGEPEEHHRVDLLEAASSLRLPMVKCPCGDYYAFLSHRCPACKGSDPVGLLLKKRWQRIETHLQALAEEEVGTSSRYKVQLERIGEVLRGKEEQCNELFELCSDEDEPGEDFAEQLLLKYQEVFDLSKLEFKALRESMLSEPREMLSALIQASSCIREIWLERAEPCWAAPEGFAAQLAVRIQEDAARYPTGLSACVGQFVRAGALLKPVYQKLQKLVNEESPLWEFVKSGWRGFRAVATMGVSEAVRFGVGMFKDAKLQKAAELGFEALEEARVLASRAADDLAEAERAHESLARLVGARLVSHCLGELAYDYCGRNREEQLDISRRIAHECGVQMPRMWKRGKDAEVAHKRWNIIWAALLVLVVLSSVFGWWLLNR